MKVVIATPTVKRPYEPNLDSLAASVPALDRAGIDHASVWEVGNPYISTARATMLRKALNANADAVVFIDHDVSWRPEDLVKLIQTEGDVVAGTYRFKHADPENMEYMGVFDSGPDGRPIVRSDGAIKAELVPGGFLKVTKEAVDRFMRKFPELVYGPAYCPSVDLFNHGAHDGAWWGEDYAFCRRWREAGGDIWLVPDMNLDHHGDDVVYPGNFHEFLLRQPGGSKSDNPVPPLQVARCENG